jgi:hypothetical protein
MAAQRIAGFEGSGVVRGGIILLSLVLVGIYAVSPLGLGLNPLARTPRILALPEEDLVSMNEGANPPPAVSAGTLLEFVAAGASGAVVRSARRDDAASTVGTLRLSAKATASLSLISVFRVKSDVTSREGPEPFALDGPKLSKGTTTVARAAVNGWVELRCGEGWGWVPRSAISTLDGVAEAEVSLYNEPDLEDNRGSLPEGATFPVLGQYGDAYLIDSSGARGSRESAGPSGLFWVRASGVEVR